MTVLKYRVADSCHIFLLAPALLVAGLPGMAH